MKSLGIYNMIYRWRIVLSLLFTFQFLLFISSCTTDAYDKGEGEYSLMRGDFVEAQVNAGKQVVSIMTDDGDRLSLAEPYTAKWIAKADTFYRCMLYYNKVEDHHGSTIADVISMWQVPCPRVMPLKEFDKELKTDPVKFESMWVSRSGKYLNMSLILKTGSTDDSTAVHQLAVVCDTVICKSMFIRLHHDQGGVPEYYSTNAYISIPASQLPADTINITLNTYDGLVQKRIVLK